MLAHQKYPNLDEIFLAVIAEHTPGDPMDSKIKWTKLTRKQIYEELHKKGITVSKNVVKRLLSLHGYVKRKIQRKTSTGTFKDRDKQFKNIERINKKFMKSETPILSIDTKKKEKLGNLHRQGEVYCNQTIESFDHD
jgi:hypothetical protein